MSNLILLSDSSAEPFQGPLAGRMLMLNTAKQTRFQTFGFVATPNSPLHEVPVLCNEEALRKAIADRILIDVTDTQGANNSADKVAGEIKQAMKQRRLTKIKEEVVTTSFIGKDAKGNTFVINPKDQDEYNAMLAEIKETGGLRLTKPVNKTEALTSGLTPIYEEDIDPPPAAGE